MRMRLFRRTMSMLGQTVEMTPGAWAIQYPMAFSAASVPPVCAPFMKTMRSTGELVDRQSMISRKYGTRSVRQGPGSAFAVGRTR